MAKKGSVKWNIPEVSDTKRSPRTPRSARSIGDSVSERYVYTDTFEEPSQSHVYTDTFVSDSQESYSDTFINGSGISKSTSGNGQSDIKTVISAVSKGDTSEHTDSAVTATGAIDTVVEVDTHATEAIDTVIEVDTHFTEAIDTVIEVDTHATEAIDTAVDSTYSDTHPPETYTYTFDTGDYTDRDDYSQTGSEKSVTRAYSDEHTSDGSQRTSYSSYTRDRSKTGSSQGSDYSISLGERSMSPRLTDEESYTEDDYSYTFEPTEISSAVHLVDPAEIERETEIQLQTEVAQKDFIEQTMARLKKDRSKQPMRMELLPLDEEEDEDEYVSHFCKKKIKLLRKKRKNGDVQVADRPHPFARKTSTKITDYGLSPIILEKMKIKRTLSAMDKAAREEFHEPKNCKTCREKKAELDALEAERLFTQSRAKTLQNKIIDAQIEEHLLKMNSVSLIADIARSLPRASEEPEKILDKLFEPLLGKNVMR